MVWLATRQGAGITFKRRREPAVRPVTGIGFVDGGLDYRTLDGADAFDPWTWPDADGLLVRCRCSPAVKRYHVLELRDLLDSMRPGQPCVLAPGVASPRR
jgi:hypothetical protein